MDANLQLSQAYVNLICNHPFFASVLLRLRRLPDPTCPTAWTDGRTLGYNPAFIARLTLPETIGVLAHEVCHVAALHPWRMQRRKRFPWNIACDHVVNHLVLEAGLKLPQGHVPPVGGKSAEELYVDQPDDGSGGDGDGCGAVREATAADGQSLTDAERELQEAETKIMVRQALNAAKRQGKLPAGLARLVEDVLEPKVPWREILARFIGANARHDYSWLQPNRRYTGGGILFPSLSTPSYGRVVMACDTSGSIDQAMLRDICSEVLGCLDVYQERGEAAELTVLWCDAQVYAQTVMDAADLNPQGGGGTSFAPVFDWLYAEGDTPAAVIYVTDGICNDFGRAPECPVLWILTQRNDAFAPPFGTITHVLHE